MYKASSGVTLPTSIIGSLPRPSWYSAGLGSQSFLEAMMNLRYREQYEDAVSSICARRRRPVSTSAPTAMRISTSRSAV